jgi:hypothetical protein
MIQSLVELGLILQRAVAGDRRRRELAFTERGKEVMRRAVGELVLGGLGTHVAGRALTDIGWPASPALRAEAIVEADELFKQLRWGLRDLAFFEYEPENQEPAPVMPDFMPEYLHVEDSTPDLTTLDDEDRGVAWAPGDELVVEEATSSGP